MNKTTREFTSKIRFLSLKTITGVNDERHGTHNQNFGQNLFYLVDRTSTLHYYYLRGFLYWHNWKLGGNWRAEVEDVRGTEVKDLEGSQDFFLTEQKIIQRRHPSVLGRKRQDEFGSEEVIER